MWKWRIILMLTINGLKRTGSASFVFFLLFALGLPFSFALPAEDVQLVTDAQRFEVARRLIQEAKTSVRVMMFDPLTD